MTKRYQTLISISLIASLTFGWHVVEAKGVVGSTATTVAPAAEGEEGVHKESVVVLTPQEIRARAFKREHAFPVDSFWDKLAQCETAQDWQNGGQWAGGLGIYTKSSFPKASMGTWERYGGEEFAPSPDKATREQQIVVANRIAVTGWKTTHVRPKEWAKRKGIPQVWEFVQRPVGLTGWGCYKSKSTGKYRMARPKVFYYENYKLVPLFKFEWNEKSHAVEDLQMLLGNVRVDGHYGPKTRQAHIEYLKKRKLSRDGVPSKPSKKTDRVKVLDVNLGS